MVDDRLAWAAGAADEARDWTHARDEAIREARRSGLSLRDIGDAVGLSHGTVDNICRR